MDIQERLTAFAYLGAEWVMWLLVILSVIGLAIILERLYFLLSARDDLEALKLDVLKKLRAGDQTGARKRLETAKSFEAKILLAGIEAVDDGPESVEERLAGQSSLAKLSMERNLAFLATVGNNAPFVGLLGTVIGVINAFRELNEGAGQVSEGLMKEVGEALVATAIGLLVALPAVAFFNVFMRIIKARLAQADALSREVMAFIKSRRVTDVGPYRDGSAAEPDALDAEADGPAEEG
ncbi:MAG: MotA/TolQ/ExbB proton channel family protein [Sandaracinaceae bacterium]